MNSQTTLLLSSAVATRQRLPSSALRTVPTSKRLGRAAGGFAVPAVAVAAAVDGAARRGGGGAGARPPCAALTIPAGARATK